jgi:DNA-binding XRE family transcriptional regulator
MHMKLEIGTNIRRLRRERELTQEALAEVLGVTAQSVSRWESDSCYPDLELLPTLADFFGTTVDRLLGVDEALEQAQVAQYQKAFREAVSRGDVAGCIAISRQGVAAYPNNEVLLNQLMYALFLAGDDDGSIPNWRENREKYDAEITALGQRLEKSCQDQNIRQEAVARLACHHWEMGRLGEAKQVCGRLPSQTFCRESQLWRVVPEEERLSAVQAWIRGSYSGLRGALYQLVESRLLPDTALLQVFETLFALEPLLVAEPVPDQSYGAARMRCAMAETYARLGQADQAVAQLRRAAQEARAWDQRPETGTYHSKLLGDYTWHRTDFETSDHRSCREIMRDKWLQAPDFDALRSTPEFAEICSLLKAEN